VIRSAVVVGEDCGCDICWQAGPEGRRSSEPELDRPEEMSTSAPGQHNNADPKYLTTYVILALLLTFAIFAQSCLLNASSKCRRRTITAISDDPAPDQRTSAILVPAGLRSLRFRYLVVYAFMVAGDWLQGPYLYALYSSYGLSRDSVTHLFVVGFGSSMVFGCLAGSLADRFGRKPLAIVYAIFYILSCSTMHFRSFGMLVFGRLLGGISTSLLFSVFESWLVKEAHGQGMRADEVGSILGTAATLNSIVAVACGQVAEVAASLFAEHSGPVVTFGGLTTPFDVASVTLAVGAIILCFTWSESSTTDMKQSVGSDQVTDISRMSDTNDAMEAGSETSPITPVELDSAPLLTDAIIVQHPERSGDGGAHDEAETKLRCCASDALMLVYSNRRVQLCGLVQSFFEGAMYSFVLLWTPVILSHTPADQTPPYGFIFGSFMACSALGSQAFNRAMAADILPEHMLIAATIVGACALAMVPLTELLDVDLTFIGFLVFECCVGVYFPTIGVIKSRIVPENSRATVYNIYRVPLNMIVLVVLLGDFTLVHTFELCSVLLAFAAVCSGLLIVTPMSTRGAYVATGNDN
jgi:MFS family permease